MVPDPSDPVCCMIPKCPNPINSTIPLGVFGQVTGFNLSPIPNLHPTSNGPNPPFQLPNNVPTPYPGYIYPPSMLPSLIPTVSPPINPNPNLTPYPQPKVCVYKGKQYTQGQRWRDGCQFNCVCDDGMTGKYTCTDICPRYPSLPANCVMVTDLANPCCKTPNCSSQTHVSLPVATPYPYPTLASTIEICNYKGMNYSLGQGWYDGCDSICECLDFGYSDCNDRCADYSFLPAECTLMTSTDDSCCEVPYCAFSANDGIVKVKTYTPNPILGHLPDKPPLTPKNDKDRIRTTIETAPRGTALFVKIEILYRLFQSYHRCQPCQDLKVVKVLEILASVFLLVAIKLIVIQMVVKKETKACKNIGALCCILGGISALVGVVMYAMMDQCDAFYFSFYCCIISAVLAICSGIVITTDSKRLKRISPLEEFQ